MVYLYAGLGVAMLAGIMAIFEMGLSLTGTSLPAPVDVGIPEYLKEMLRYSSDLDADLEGKEMCEKLDEAYKSKNNGKNEGSDYAASRIFLARLEFPEKLMEGCVLEYDDESDLDQIFLGKRGGEDVGLDNSYPYLMFYCLSSGLSPDFCPLEKISEMETW